MSVILLGNVGTRSQEDSPRLLPKSAHAFERSAVAVSLIRRTVYYTNLGVLQSTIRGDHRNDAGGNEGIDHEFIFKHAWGLVRMIVLVVHVMGVQRIAALDVALMRDEAVHMQRS